MCPCEPENAAPLGAVNPNLSPFQNRAPPFGSRKYQMPIVSRKPKGGIGKGRNIEGITFTGRAGTLSDMERSVRVRGLAPFFLRTASIALGMGAPEFSTDNYHI